MFMYVIVCILDPNKEKNPQRHQIPYETSELFDAPLIITSVIILIVFRPYFDFLSGSFYSKNDLLFRARKLSSI